MNNYIDEHEIKRAINALKEPNDLFEIRVPGAATYSGYFTDTATAIKELSRLNLTGRNVFITLQNIDKACYSREQHDRMIKIYRQPTTSDGNIKAYEWLLIDLDPERPAGVSSSDEELKEAGETAKRVIGYLGRHNFTEPIIAMSGNGYHLLYKIDLANTDENKSIVEKALKALDMLFSTKAVKVDTSVFNPARISKLYGTTAQKGANTEERPHRMSKLIRVPDQIQTTPAAALKELAAVLPKEEPRKKEYKNGGGPFDVYEFLNKNGIRYTEKAGDGYTKLILDECIFNPDHKAPDAMVTISNSGELGYKCLHNSCSGNHWREFRLKLDPNAYDTPANDYRERATRSEEPTAAAEENAQGLTGLLTYESAVNAFISSNDKILELPKFPEFSKQAKIKLHDSVVLSADTGAGKSSLALNFIDNVNDKYPVMYFNLEMDELTILRRLVAIRTGLELDRIEGYKYDEQTAAAVNSALKIITERQPIQIIQDKYKLSEIESEIKKATAEREEPTIVIIDHSLLVTTDESFTRYERFTRISEELRRISRLNNVIMFVLLQQNRDGKADESKRPTNASLKESGSWENDATHILFLWYDPNANRKKLLMTKNRAGMLGDFDLEYYAITQFYKEAKEQTTNDAPTKNRKSKRDQQRDQLQRWYTEAYTATNGKPTLADIAEAAGETTGVVMRRIKEFGGFIVEGKEYDPAGVDTDIEKSAFIRLTIGEAGEFEEERPGVKKIF